ncbi:SIS domain-containing protein [Salmonella enterica]|nr:SIS domain-containing protein [Salmonella enterica]
MTMIQRYLNIVQKKLNDISRQQSDKIISAAGELAKVINQGGVIYIFGCGHSHIFAEDVFYRAGGIAPVRPIFIEPLMLHEGAAASSYYEKKNDYITDYLEKFAITSKDALIVISTSGINPAPVDAALWAKQHGAFTLALTSFLYADTQPSKHKAGLKLRDSVDMAIDNQVPIGDAVLSLTDHATPFAPISSLTGLFIMHALFAEIIANLGRENKCLPVFLSGNIANSAQHNESLLEKYGAQIPELTNNYNFK